MTIIIFNIIVIDYYLPYYNLCIEYDGEQHHMPTIIKKGHIRTSNCKQGRKNLQDIQTRDLIKTNYFRSRHIYLLRIPYTKQKQIPQLIERKIAQIKAKKNNSLIIMNN